MSIATTSGTIVPATDRLAPPAAADGVEPGLRRVIPLVVARLRQRHPTVDSAQVARCVDEAVDRGATARVRDFLPILIERWASDALAALPRP